jgi:hypothetical protein
MRAVVAEMKKGVAMRRVLLRGVILLAAVAGAGPAGVFARLVESWPYARLLRESQLVVIARPVATADSGDRTTENPWKVEFLGVNTDFRVEAVLKGTLDGDKLRVLHFRLPKGKRIYNGPGLVSFRMQGITLRTNTGGKVSLAKTPAYLLFLKRGKDGRYEPVSGRIDPISSVREMHQPLREADDD